jgi:hypothetical protein
MRKPRYTPNRNEERYAQLWAELELPKLLNQKERKE